MSVDFKIGAVYFEWNVLVAAIREDGLLGLDFLHYHYYNKSGLKLRVERCETLIPLRADRVKCTETISFPPDSECIIHGKANSSSIAFKTRHFNHQKVIHDLSRIQEHITFGHSVYDTKQLKKGQSLPIKVINTSQEKVTINEGLSWGE
jgi:hypothetical protein